MPIDVMWNNWLKAKVPESKAFVLELLFRLCLAILSGKHLAYLMEANICILTIPHLPVLLAVAWPNLTLILSFVGAFCLSFLGLIFPAIIDISIRYEKGYGPLKIYLLLSVIVILFGVVGGITGSYVPIEQMIKLYLNGTNLTG